MNKTLETTIRMMSAVRDGAQMKVSRNFLDFFADRIRQACTEASLVSMMEHLVESVEFAADKIAETTVTAFLTECANPDAPAVVAWLSGHSRIAAMLSAVTDEAMLLSSLESIDIEADEGASGAAPQRRGFDIPIRVQCLSPLSHGADIKAGNATMFRRLDVLTDTDKVLSLPYYAGNAFRGRMRDLLADHLLDNLGLVPSRSNPPIEPYFFQVLYSGGALEEKTSKAHKAVAAVLGSAGAVKARGVHRFRDTLPSISLLGCSVGNKILAGRIQVNDLRPLCKQWGTGEQNVSQLFCWEFLTRREDREEYDKHSGMIATTECLKTGVELEGGVDLLGHISEVELSALAVGLELMRKQGRLGAEGRRGLGSVEIEYDNLPSSEPYETFLAENKDMILDFLREISAIAPAGSDE